MSLPTTNRNNFKSSMIYGFLNVVDYTPMITISGITISGATISGQIISQQDMIIKNYYILQSVLTISGLPNTLQNNLINYDTSGNIFSKYVNYTYLSNNYYDQLTINQNISSLSGLIYGHTNSINTINTNISSISGLIYGNTNSIYTLSGLIYGNTSNQNILTLSGLIYGNTNYINKLSGF